ncbi:MAG: FAD-dependent oxidoreductase [Candidatus Omnitrophica bacterium]|nr:FAD-dependent oxidoreductase [Candidatus Omnitrophota bacterium]
MKSFYAVLSERIVRTSTIESFRFKLEAKIDFEPGQFLKLIFDQADINNKTLNKYLSFSSSPLNDYIEVTKRLSESDFSSSLKALKPGDKLMFQGPMGNCVFKQSYEKIGFLIGGIGITPVISIIEYIAQKKLNTDIVLMYSNRHHGEIAFRQELDNWQKEHKGLNIVYTLTDCLPEDHICIHGQIDQGLLQKHITDMQQRRLFIFGPPVMVEAMKKMCDDSGCVKDLILAENFVGY